ncbi:calcium-binding protein 39-like isoform X1 [Falco rusticolus]|uniref:calcium-binding protein 39-like isoform X1 n=1 Tax=Falco rusticolus TaxID=120794 RepID=UPI001886A8B8|nr:calcium-binding protein 39-like isoform X1 [Falco rusticolus]XP_037231846.1 calcium-binding protein 39-like isoform X1 [Falco rusticolus]XP_037231847.1 calcium-binding protein 39-like isoform X1 [Falco rusticolus]XP_037231848.1 calcium-binding protein 39-like isoform X1 [Falco rusticolus]XP_037231849.1 calcium-binding protein 39-like isoform X1 [Falco rusticolus]XP_037231850.1 calcium-binding protein 39-like isoform X1 [Falco rusticolus]
MPLFSKSHKNPAEIVKILKENMAILEKQEKKTDKASEEVSKSLQAMKEILCGTTDKEPPTEIVAQLAQELYNSGLLVTLIANLQLIDFEGKKDVSQIFNNILRRQIGTRSPTVEYISAHPHILFMLLKGYETPNIALRCGIMLRECIRHEPLAKIILFSEQFRDFFKYVEMSTFDIASDAFATFKDLLTRHKLLVAEFLEQNYDVIFEDYEKLLHSENYVTKRQSLKLLGELILDRHNFAIMTKYISKPENLKLMMNLLRDKSPNIQFEAFHVFKVRSKASSFWLGLRVVSQVAMRRMLQVTKYTASRQYPGYLPQTLRSFYHVILGKEMKKKKSSNSTLRLKVDGAGTVHQCKHNLLLKALERFGKSDLEINLIRPFAVIINAVLNNYQTQPVSHFP